MQNEVPRVLFVTYGGGHVAMVSAVARRMIEQGAANPTVIALTIAPDACRRAGIPFLAARDLLPATEDEREQVRAVGNRIVAGLGTHPSVDHEDSVAYHGLSFHDLTKLHGEEAAAELFRQLGRRAFYPVALFERLIAELRPDVVVATNSPRSERAAIQAAVNLGVPSCCMIDLFASRADWLADSGFADRLCVLNDAVRDALVARGRPASHIVVTGNPAFDSLRDVIDQRRSRPAGDSFCVFWAANPEPSIHPLDGRRGLEGLNDRIARELRLCAERHPEWDVVVRPHPAEGTFELEGTTNLRVIRDERLEDRLIHADIVITTVSTVGIQASLVGIPTISVEGSIFASELPLADYGFAHSVPLELLCDRLEALHDDPIPLNSGFAAVGRAADRVVNVIVELAESSHARAER